MAIEALETSSLTAGRPRRGRPPASDGGETRQRILRGAREVISEVGYDAATFLEIARRAGLTRPAINYHYANKAVLYRAVVADVNAQIFDHAVKKANEQATLGSQLEVFVTEAIRTTSEDRSPAAFLITSVLESERRPGLVGADADTTTRLRTFLNEAVSAAVERGEIGSDIDVTSLAELLLTIMWGLGLYAGYIGNDQSTEAVADQMNRFLRHLFDNSHTNPMSSASSNRQRLRVAAG